MTFTKVEGSMPYVCSQSFEAFRRVSLQSAICYLLAPLTVSSTHENWISAEA